MADQNIDILRKKTYLKAIENSVGSKLFNSLYVRRKDSGEVVDITNDGEYSCAFFVSSVLYLLGAVAKPSATVESLRGLIGNNPLWKRVETGTQEAGDVIFWEKLKYEDGAENAHVGFVLNSNEAVSTDYKNKIISQHPLEQPERKIEAFYRYTWDD